MTAPVRLPKAAEAPDPADAPIVIAASSFLMGCDRGADDERPAHRVRVGAFALARHPVTNAEYARFLEATGAAAPPTWSDPRFGDHDQPVVSVSWFDAVAYCEWLAHRSGRPARLPTEAEWECAARGGVEGALYPWGDDSPQSLPGYASRWIDRPEPVGRSTPNAFCLRGMCENVHEWCSDWYGADYYAISPDRNPQGPEEGQRRASRGGSWRHHIKISQCSARSSIPPEYKYADYGFRVVYDGPR